MPVPSTVVGSECAVAGTTTQGEDQRGDEEDDNNGELEARRPELLLCKAERAEDVENDDDGRENGDVDGDVNGVIFVPELNRKGGGRKSSR